MRFRTSFPTFFPGQQTTQDPVMFVVIGPIDGVGRERGTEIVQLRPRPRRSHRDLNPAALRGAAGALRQTAGAFGGPFGGAARGYGGAAGVHESLRVW